MALVTSLRPELTAIDAPLALPPGLCCLEESCPRCGLRSFSLRPAEKDLARQHIGCFYTTRKSIIKAMVYRGIALRRELAWQGHQVVEVYPYGSKVRLWGKPPPKKTKGPGLDWVRQKLAQALPALRPHLPSFDHNLCDAALAAYTAWLHLRGATEVLGEEAGGQIALPAPSPSPSRERGPALRRKGQGVRGLCHI